jgi:hypothetical protein
MHIFSNKNFVNSCESLRKGILALWMSHLHVFCSCLWKVWSNRRKTRLLYKGAAILQLGLCPRILRIRENRPDNSQTISVSQCELPFGVYTDRVIYVDLVHSFLLQNVHSPSCYSWSYHVYHLSQFTSSAKDQIYCKMIRLVVILDYNGIMRHEYVASVLNCWNISAKHCIIIGLKSWYLESGQLMLILQCPLCWACPECFNETHYFPSEAVSKQVSCMRLFLVL